VPRHELHRGAERRCVALGQHRQVFFARRLGRGPPRPAQHSARVAGRRVERLAARVEREAIHRRPADDSRQHLDRADESVDAESLAARVPVDDRAWADRVHEIVETAERQRRRKRRRAAGDQFALNAEPSGQRRELGVDRVRLRRALFDRAAVQMAVVAVQAGECRTGRRDDFGAASELCERDAGAVVAGVEVDEGPESAAPQRARVFGLFAQHAAAVPRGAGGERGDPVEIGAVLRHREQHVDRGGAWSGVGGGEQDLGFARRRALEAANAGLQQQRQHFGDLARLHVGAPAVEPAAEPAFHRREVVADRVEVDQQGRGLQVVDAHRRQCSALRGAGVP
jgi:hypothetical protein